MRKLLVCLLALILALPALELASEGMQFSPTTGLPTYDPVYHPVAVQIDNNPNAVPQIGVYYADVFYETPLAAGGYTRLTAIFNDVIPGIVGSVRSARIMHCSIANEWQAAFVYFGGQTKDGTSIKEYFDRYPNSRKIDLSVGSSIPYFYRTKDRQPPHNAICYLQDTFNFLGEGSGNAVRSFLFSADAPSTSNVVVTSLFIDRGRDPYSATFTFLPDYGKYRRTTSKDKEGYIDDLNGEELLFSNIIVQRAKVTHYKGDGDRPIVDLVGSGVAEYFINGHYIKGTWSRSSENSRTIFYDDMGREIVLKPGKTYIAIVPNPLSLTLTQGDEQSIQSTGVGGADELEVVDVASQYD